MEAKQIVNVVAPECRPELESEFVRWLTEVDIPMLFKFKGLKQANLYKRLYEAPGYPKYLGIYIFDSQSAFEAYESSPELAAARKDAAEHWKKGDFELKWRVQYEPMGSWQK